MFCEMFVNVTSLS